MSTKYDQKAIEQKWQKKWQEMNLYHFDFENPKPVYSIDVPPRYASGPLHAGHAVHYTHIDFVARYKRMRGFNVFFPLCFDVNGIPIEERVERQRNITRKDIDRHKFTKLCSEFAEKNIKTMTKQFIQLGESMDDSIYYQTNAKNYRRLTQISFIELYHQGHIYKGEFPVNWCPRCMTAMADAEINYKDRDTTLNTIKFYFTEEQPEQLLKYHGIDKDSKGMYVEIATTRPEMLPSCQIVAVHPQDERAPWLVDKKLRVPLFDKEVKIVSDDAVDPDFGSGVVMICTVGDKEDLNWVFKYDLPLEMSINEEGRMTDICGKYQDMPIMDARKAVIKDMKQQNILVNTEPLKQSIGVCWRCKTPVEFINAEQWFLKTIPFKDMVLQASDDMNWYPDFMEVRLKDWVDSLEWDWVISRQRYFATPIPLWECQKCDHVVVARPEDCYVDPTLDDPPVEKCPECGGPLKGSEDVFDTWMDSSISPLYNAFWHRDKQKFKQLYPMSLRPQSHDIIRTWAFYTILRCTLLTDEKPFENMMMGGFILSEDGTPMHASLGNVIDPLEILDEYGTDAFRYYAASCTLGEDNPFRHKDVIRGTRLLRKLWNAQQFINTALGNKKPEQKNLKDIDRMLLSQYSKLVKECTELMDTFEFSQVMKKIEYFLWHELADHYIEMVKSSVYDEKDNTGTLYTLYQVGLGLTKMFSPFFPHIAEEIYQKQYQQFEKEKSIHFSPWPKPILLDEKAETRGEIVKQYIAEARSYKSSQGIQLNAAFPVSATYSPDKQKIEALQTNKKTIISTLNYPQDHEFIVEPSIVEKVTEIKPVYSKIGPLFKKDSKKITQWIKENQDSLIKKIEEHGDLTWDDISPTKMQKQKNETLIENGYIEIEKKPVIKGKKAIQVIEDVYLTLDASL